MDYPLVICQNSYWKWPSRNSGFTQLENGGSFHSYVAVYQRVYEHITWPSSLTTWCQILVSSNLENLKVGGFELGHLWTGSIAMTCKWVVFAPFKKGTKKGYWKKGVRHGQSTINPFGLIASVHIQLVTVVSSSPTFYHVWYWSG